jgi:NADH:ubiquinone oxidoreductase subunit F (NADH-binding)/(2Fe-2S) ferredoxin/NAD-dependent dihydropyrimidine dehydrogenase PreA subunit
MNLEELKSQASQRAQEEAGVPEVRVGLSTCGRAAGAVKVAEALRSAVARAGVSAAVREVGCLGLCYLEPMVEVVLPGKPGVLYGKVKPGDAEKIVADHLHGGQPIKELALAVMAETGNGVPAFRDLPMLQGQLRVATRNIGRVQLETLDGYIRAGGYEGLAKALALKPEDVIAEVKKSGLRGRGGAGFPTGQKWEFARKTQSFPKYLIANGDEGEHGAFMDRAIMEGDPHSVIEGMAIAAWAIAGNQGPIHGYIYVRAEFPLAIQDLTRAIAQAREAGILGGNVLGSGFGFDVTIYMGAGVFVCGEETALIASIEGKPGLPRTRPPFPAEAGLFGKPTNINNIETLATLPVIITRGGDWLKNIGVPGNSGTKAVSLGGSIRHTGLVEVPMGTPLRDLIFKMGGGIKGQRKLKAVQTAGPSGGSIPESLLDLPLTYEGLMSAGAIMGSGGMIVMDEQTCMVEMARYFMNFAAEESCGKCTPCREGTRRMGDILERICAGEGQEGDLETLERMGKAIINASLCGLGQAAPNATLSTLKYFRPEYEAHIRDKKCPAGVCKALIKYRISAEACTGCGACRPNCPTQAITGEDQAGHVLDQTKCVKCGACRESCDYDAVIIE